jgi:hypothetical protein
MTLEEILEEAWRLPADQIAVLIDRLALLLHPAGDPEVEAAWMDEAERRLKDVESGEVVARRVDRIVEP